VCGVVRVWTDIGWDVRRVCEPELDLELLVAAIVPPV
jgi:hypothetical protein